MKLFTLLIMLVPSIVFAQEPTKVIQVADNQYHWEITVENCAIDPDAKTTFVKKPRLPQEKIIVRQNGRVQRCDVKQINIVSLA